jgi:hypothetical protein
MEEFKKKKEELGITAVEFVNKPKGKPGPKPKPKGSSAAVSNTSKSKDSPGLMTEEDFVEADSAEAEQEDEVSEVESDQATYLVTYALYSPGDIPKYRADSRRFSSTALANQYVSDIFYGTPQLVDESEINPDEVVEDLDENDLLTKQVIVNDKIWIVKAQDIDDFLGN